MYYIYVLYSIHYPKRYVGCTGDIQRRLTEHNSGKMSFTKRYMPWKLIHSEGFETLAEARCREKYLKTGAGRRFLKTISNNYSEIV
ncbi:MAG: GIY-YIG nuclease family protein [Patescibacteria group bacterium]